MNVEQSARFNAAISLESVTKVFNQTQDPHKPAFVAVDDVTVHIKRGQLVALLGKTGCGKSTIFNMIAGLLEPTKGAVFIDGADPFHSFNALRGKIAIVFQNDRLLPWRTARENVEVGLDILGMPPEGRRILASEWLRKLGLAGHEDDYPHALSGGMRQRVSIARAFATRASILLCDEPFSALDEMTANRLRLEFFDLVRENEKTAVFITHSINEAIQIGDRIIVLDRPARIALDMIVRRDENEAMDDLRKKILDVLGSPNSEVMRG